MDISALLPPSGGTGNTSTGSTGSTTTTPSDNTSTDSAGSSQPHDDWGDTGTTDTDDGTYSSTTGSQPEDTGEAGSEGGPSNDDTTPTTPTAGEDSGSQPEIDGDGSYQPVADSGSDPGPEPVVEPDETAAEPAEPQDDAGSESGIIGNDVDEPVADDGADDEAPLTDAAAAQNPHASDPVEEPPASDIYPDAVASGEDDAVAEDTAGEVEPEQNGVAEEDLQAGDDGESVLEDDPAPVDGDGGSTGIEPDGQVDTGGLGRTPETSIGRGYEATDRTMAMDNSPMPVSPPPSFSRDLLDGALKAIEIEDSRARKWAENALQEIRFGSVLETLASGDSTHLSLLSDRAPEGDAAPRLARFYQEF